MTPAKKKQRRKKAKPSEESAHDYKKKLEALALAVFTALGFGIGDGMVHAWTAHQEQRQEEKQKPLLVPGVVPGAELPYGDEPKQRLRFRYLDDEGNESYSFTHAASLRQIVFDAYKPITSQPTEGEETFSINYQLTPSAPTFRVNMPQSQLAHLWGNQNLKIPSLGSVKHLEISPEPLRTPNPDPDKPSEA